MYLSVFLAAAAVTIGILVGFMAVVRIRRAMDRRYGRQADRKRRRAARKGKRLKRRAAASAVKARRREERNGRAAEAVSRREAAKEVRGGEREKKADDGHIPLRDRMVDKSDSRMEFDCMAEGIDPAEYIKQKRNQQDSQYNYAKRRQDNAEKGGW